MLHAPRPTHVLYAATKLVARCALRAYFGRIDVEHADRLPADGPVLVIANHPASLTDVLVLGTVLPRRLHFLAHSGLFHPAPRGFLLRVFGALPVFRREDDAAETYRNDTTFRACTDLFDAGGVVVIFPEGTSQADRELLRLKTGAARLALSYDAGAGAAARRRGRLRVVPVGLHFVERTAFRSDVVISVGDVLDLAAYRDRYAHDAESAVRALTHAMRAALEGLIVQVPIEEMASLIRDLERLYVDELRKTTSDTSEVTLLQGVADCVEYFAREDPARLYGVWRQLARYRRRLARLALRDEEVRGRMPHMMLGRTSARLVVVGALGLVPALAGAIVHTVPYRLTGLIGGRVAPDPTRIAFARIVTGVFLFPLTYAVFGALLWKAGVAPLTIVVVLAASVPLGFFALVYRNWLARERQQLRLAVLTATNGRLVARLRAERRAVIAQLEAARRDYAAAIAAAQARTRA